MQILRTVAHCHILYSKKMKLLHIICTSPYISNTPKCEYINIYTSNVQEGSKRIQLYSTAYPSHRTFYISYKKCEQANRMD